MKYGRPIGFALPLFVLLTGCASLPTLEGRSETRAQTDTESTRLGRSVASRAAAHPGKAGIHALTQPKDALVARVLLAEAAEKSLDVQYYIWHDDQTGTLLFEAMWRAAQRGVRVRILLDDANTEGLDQLIAALDSHPNIEVRLYNPLMQRKARLLNFVTDFTRVNRRMHNKSFTADSQVSIVGGRNVGNEYFGAGDAAPFADLDVIAVGPVVREVSNEFDLYWNSASAYPADRIVRSADYTVAAETIGMKFRTARDDPESVSYLEALRTTDLVKELLAGRLPLDWANAQVVRDNPAKTLDTHDRTDVLLISDLLNKIGHPAKSFDLVSPYFVPGADGTATLAAVAQRGVRVRVLTNSLAVTDVPPVHAGYAKRRCDLLKAGVQLYEFKPSAPKGEKSGGNGKGSSGSSGQLHAKTFALDANRIFVGSFNWDQRSARLNTEMGLVIWSPDLAGRLSSAFDQQVPTIAYQLRLTNDENCFEWIERTPNGEIVYREEPHTSAAKRAWILFLGVLPIEWLL
jgi:putative cardiolipin synthase